MRIITKRLKVIQMTQEEIKKFHALMERAAAGQTTNYAEEQLSDGSFLGVQVVETDTSAVRVNGKRSASAPDNLPRAYDE